MAEWLDKGILMVSHTPLRDMSSYASPPCGWMAWQRHLNGQPYATARYEWLCLPALWLNGLTKAFEWLPIRHCALWVAMSPRPMAERLDKGFLMVSHTPLRAMSGCASPPYGWMAWQRHFNGQPYATARYEWLCLPALWLNGLTKAFKWSTIRHCALWVAVQTEPGVYDDVPVL